MPNVLKKYLPLFIIILSLGLVILFRIVFPWNSIFTENGVNFSGVDCYYYTHLADIISHNNLQIPKYDAYFDFPQGLDYTTLPSTFNAYGFFIAVLVWIFTLGNPTKLAVDLVGAIHPAVLGILALMPIFFITRSITKNNLLSSCAVFVGAIMPGEYMGRAMLGTCDTHCLEIFLFSYAIMFTILALNDKGISRIIYSLLSGATAGLYFMIWQGAILFLIILSIFACFWLMWSRIKGSADYDSIFMILSIESVAILVYLILSSGHIANSVVSLFAPLVLIIAVLIYTFATQKFNKWVYLTPIVIGVVGILGIAISIKFVGYSFYPQWFESSVLQALNLISWHYQTTTSEELPLLITLGNVTTEIPWVYFSLSWYLTFVGIGLLIYYWIKKNDLNIFFLLSWTLFILLPTLAMRRFAYYFAINAIIISTWSIWLLFKYTLSIYQPNQLVNKDKIK